MRGNMKKGKIFWGKILAGIAGLALAFCLGTLVSRLLYGGGEGEQNVLAEETPKPALTEEEQEEQFRAMKETMAGAAAVDAPGTSAGDSAQADGEEQEGEAPDTVDFSYLQTVNGDIYAWITIPGTNIDYPVLQHPSDDSYYLHHNLDGSYGYPACIYTEASNAKDFSDPNTVLYGHNMRSAGTMFAQLHKFAAKDFFEQNREVIIYLPDRELHYRVFAAYAYDDRHLLKSFDFQDETVFAEYLQSVYDIRDMSANIDRELEVTSEDQILTLSTCMVDKNDSERRFLVQAVLTEEK